MKTKETIKKEFEAFTPNPMIDIATKYIMEIDDLKFWAKEAAPFVGNAIGLIMEFATTGLLIRNKIAKMSQATGEITVDPRTI